MQILISIPDWILSSQFNIGVISSGFALCAVVILNLILERFKNKNEIRRMRYTKKLEVGEVLISTLYTDQLGYLRTADFFRRIKQSKDSGKILSIEDIKVLQDGARTKRQEAIEQAKKNLDVTSKAKAFFIVDFTRPDETLRKAEDCYFDYSAFLNKYKFDIEKENFTKEMRQEYMGLIYRLVEIFDEANIEIEKIIKSVRRQMKNSN